MSDRPEKAYELRIAGMPIYQIAEELHCTEAEAFEAVREAIKANPRPDREAMRVEMIASYDDLEHTLLGEFTPSPEVDALLRRIRQQRQAIGG